MSLWSIGGASARGASHIRGGRPNQDAVKWTPLGGKGPAVAAAVSDGHGARAHFRSEIGSRLAVEHAIERMSGAHEDDGDSGGGAVLAGDILRGWRRSIESHAANHPYTEEEGQPGPGPRLSPYGATLLTMAAGEDVITLLQIGDGDLLLGYADGRIERPLKPDAGLKGEETFSLCQEDAETRFRVASLWRTDAVWPDFALLSTDGVAKSYESDAAFEAAVARLRDLAKQDWTGLMAGLPGWLSELSAKGSGDDATLAIALRTPINGRHP